MTERRHRPLPRVDRLAQAAQLPVVLEGSTRHAVLGVGGSADAQRRVVAPLVGVADLVREAGELLERLGLGVIGHPFSATNCIAHRHQQLVDHLLATVLGVLGEGGGHVELGDLLADVGARGVEHALPARPLLLLTAKRAPEEVERLVRERWRQRTRVGAHEVPAQVVAKRLRGGLGKRGFQRGEEAGVVDVDACRGHAEIAHEAGQSEGGHQLVE